MSRYNFAGFPLRQAMPRGHSFVHFMRSIRADGASESGDHSRGGGSDSGGNVGKVPGGFDKEAQGTITSQRKTEMPDGTIVTNAERTFSDGSHRTETWHKRPDGTFEIAAERRSLPDEAGMQRVRVWRPVTAPDGTQRSTFRVFRVPTGMKLDWDSAGAQQYLTVSMRTTKAADGTILSQKTDPLPTVASASEMTDPSEASGRDTTAPQTRTPPASGQPQESFIF